MQNHFDAVIFGARNFHFRPIWYKKTGAKYRQHKMEFIYGYSESRV